MTKLTTRITANRVLMSLATVFCLGACDPSSTPRSANAQDPITTEAEIEETLEADDEMAPVTDREADDIDLTEVAAGEDALEHEIIGEEEPIDMEFEEEVADELAVDEGIDPEEYAEICDNHDYQTNRDPACARAYYEEVVHDFRIETTTAKEARIEACLAEGGEPHYNKDAPAKLGCLNGRNILKHSAYGNGKQLPFPDYDPTVGDDDDTALECAFKDAEYIREAALELNSGKPKLKGGFRWVVYNGSQQLCIKR